MQLHRAECNRLKSGLRTRPDLRAFRRGFYSRRITAGRGRIGNTNRGSAPGFRLGRRPIRASSKGGPNETLDHARCFERKLLQALIASGESRAGGPPDEPPRGRAAYTPALAQSSRTPVLTGIERQD